MSSHPTLPPAETWLPLVELALTEDIGPGDATTRAVIEPGREGGAVIEARESLVVCGLAVAAEVFEQIDPDVSFHLFRPEGDEMRILSGSPMKLFYRDEVEGIAYENTTAKIRDRLPELSRDFAAHGVRFRDPDEDMKSVRPPARFSTEHLGL